MTEEGARFLWESLLGVVSRRKISMLGDREVEKIIYLRIFYS